MGFRRKMGKRQSRRLFSRTAGANKVHPKNAQKSAGLMRGGIRL